MGEISIAKAHTANCTCQFGGEGHGGAQEAAAAAQKERCRSLEGPKATYLGTKRTNGAPRTRRPSLLMPHISATGLGPPARVPRPAVRFRGPSDAIGVASPPGGRD
ncbi:hypothetical protein B296_00051763, partial [Ensete ventricosum]